MKMWKQLELCKLKKKCLGHALSKVPPGEKCQRQEILRFEQIITLTKEMQGIGKPVELASGWSGADRRGLLLS